MNWWASASQTPYSRGSLPGFKKAHFFFVTLIFLVAVRCWYEISKGLNFILQLHVMEIWKKLAEYKLVRKFVYATVGLFSYPGLAIINKLRISGTEHIENLPKKKRAICFQSPNLF